MASASEHILVTGGAGFIGSHLTDHLLEKGYRVTVVDNLINGTRENLAQAGKSDRFEFVEGDINDQSLVKDLCNKADYVFHLACLGVRHSLHSPYPNHTANAEGTINLLEAARESDVKHFFYISSSEIFGRAQHFPLKEDSLPAPTTVYGASKLVGEHYTLAYDEMNWVKGTVLRIFNNYGPRAHYEGDAGEVIPRTMVNVLYDKAPVVFGDGQVTRDFFYVKDTARALGQLLDLREKLAGEVMNIGTGEEMTILSLMQQILAVMNREDLQIKHLPDRPADVPRLWVDASRFYDLTGFKASVTFEEGLKETLAYYEALREQKDLLSEVKDVNWADTASTKA